jgi:serine/threonine protein kinase
VAIKVVSGGRSQDEQERIAIEREGAQIQQRIAQGDPLHIVAVNRLLFRKGDLIVEMEFVPGESLAEVIRNHTALPPKRAARIALELSRMLANLDRIQPPVVHGDLKPSNVLLRGDADIKVVDFGIAKQLSHGRGTFNQFQSVPYSSPERLRTGDVDPQSDLWALGVMLYEMAAGRHPFSAPLNMIRMRTLDGRGPDPLPADCPPPLANIVYKTLATQMPDRYPSAHALSEDLLRYINDQPVDPDATVRTVRPTPPPPPPPSSLLLAQWRLPFHLPRISPDIRLSIVGLLAFILIYFAHSQYVVARDGAEQRRSLVAGQVTLDQAWDELFNLRKSAWVPFVLYGLQDTIKAKLLDEGSEPIMDYRQDTPTATLADWQRSQTDFIRYLQLEPRNRVAMGREHICEGQIARFKSRYLFHGRWNLNSKLLSQAIAHFQQAAELMPDSPDPYLSMAPVYLYYQQDSERGMAMQAAAVKRGHPSGKRETAQLADALKANAKHDLSLAQTVDDTSDRKKQHLQNAISAFDSSIEYYGQIAGFAGSSQGLREALQLRDQAQRLLDEL